MGFSLRTVVNSGAAILVLAFGAVGCGAGASARPVGAAPDRASAWPEAFSDARHSSQTTARGPQVAHILWTRKLEGAATPGPAIGIDGSILAASNGGVLHALNPTTGADRWTYNGGGSYGSDLSTTPAVLADGTILWPGPGDRLIALTHSGRLLWSQQFAGFVLSPAIGGSGRIYVADMAGHLSALDVSATTHHLAWTIRTGSVSYGSPAIGPGGTVYTTADRQCARPLAIHGQR